LVDASVHEVCADARKSLADHGVRDSPQREAASKFAAAVATALCAIAGEGYSD
jgi:hypothetical protein